MEDADAATTPGQVVSRLPAVTTTAGNRRPVPLPAVTGTVA